MTTLAYSHTAAGHRATGVFAKLIAAVDAWSKARRTYAALSSLSDRELDDIGLTRGDLNAVARGDLPRF